jgi:2-polyprenyl-3-methyl-5-hydroxy-6-metoxy-1,4-benzoquinol methylase
MTDTAEIAFTKNPQEFEKEFLDAIKNDVAREFTRATMIEHYVDAILYHHPNPANLTHSIVAAQTTTLVNQIFDTLLKCDPSNLSTELLRLGRKQPSRIPEWFIEFDQAYDHYKNTSKLPFIAEFLLPAMEHTTSLLDFGCGDGEIVTFLGKKLGLDSVSGVDVLDWRSEKNKNNSNFNFYKHDFSNKNVSTNIPVHSTGLMHAMLHHVSNKPDEIAAYLHATSKAISGELLVVEDVLYDKNHSYSELPGISSLTVAKNSQPNFKQYVDLELKNQKDVITILDLLSNSLAMGIPEMNFPFGAQELNQWVKIFENAGLQLKMVKVLGFQNHLFHRMSQVLFVLGV